MLENVKLQIINYFNTPPASAEDALNIAVGDIARHLEPSEENFEVLCDALKIKFISDSNGYEWNAVGRAVMRFKKLQGKSISYESYDNKY